MVFVTLQAMQSDRYMQQVEADDSEDSTETRAIEEAEAEAAGIAVSVAARAGAAKTTLERRAAVAGSALSSRTRGAAAVTSSACEQTAGMGGASLAGQELSQGEFDSAGLADMEEDSVAPSTLEPCLDFKLPDEILAGLKVIQLTPNRSRQAVENAAAAGPLSQ